jgi:FkbM family methyltransferase
MLRHLLNVEEVDAIWSWLLARHPNKEKATVVEVGAFDCKQTLEAAKLGYRVLAVEPSPANLAKCRQLLGQNPDAARRIELIEKAAGNATGTVQFNADGTTGDHVGHNPGEVNTAYHSGQKMVTVSIERVDKLLEDRNVQWIYVLKIDTQGFDLFVLQGLERILQQKRVLYIITEFWPTGLRGTHGRDAAEILYLLSKYGYTIFDSRTLYLRNNCCPTAIPTGEDFTRPTINAYQYSAWFEERDQKHGDKFGTWTDLLAQANVNSEEMKQFYPS